MNFHIKPALESDQLNQHFSHSLEQPDSSLIQEYHGHHSQVMLYLFILSGLFKQMGIKAAPLLHLQSMTLV